MGECSVAIREVMDLLPVSIRLRRGGEREVYTRALRPNVSFALAPGLCANEPVSRCLSGCLSGP